MKKIFLLTILLFQLTFVFGQNAQWDNWQVVSCYKGFQTSSISYGFNKYGNGYEWNWKVKSNYNKKVSFNLTVTIGNDKKDWGRFTLSPGDEHKHVSFYYNNASPNIKIEITKVCFSDNYLDNCWAECDNGTPNQPNCDKKTSFSTSSFSSNTTTTKQNDLTEYNRSKADLERQMADKNAEIQRQNLETQRQQQLLKQQQEQQKQQQLEQGINQISSSLIDLARSLDVAKEEKRLKLEQERLAQEQLQREGEQQAALASEEMEGQWKIANDYSDLESIEGYKKAIQIMLPYATDNRLNGMALNTIGFWYWKLEDYKNAKLWYSKAYDKGNASASRNLGVLYLNGMGVDKNKKEAIYYFQEACEKGIEKSCEEYKNFRNELEIFNEKSENKNYKDLCFIAQSYYKEKNYTKSVDFFSIAYEINTSAKWTIPYNIANMYKDENKLNNKELATLWFEKTIKKMENEKNIQQTNNTSTSFVDNDYVNILLYYGNSIKEKDGKLAIDVFLKAVRNKSSGIYSKFDGGNYIGAYTEVGLIYELGLGGVEKDWKQAQYYYEKDAERQSAVAMNHLGQLFEKGGPNLEESKKESKKWFKMACKVDKKYCK